MNTHTILVIEDNPLNLELVTDLLEACGFTVRQSRTATDGLRAAREAAPDLVLMDFGLRDMHGLSATQILKSDPATCHLPVIALTAHAMKGDEASALQAGCDGFLTKPIDTRTFATTVRYFLSRKIPFTSTQAA
jgi:CheY-like chemotaxis protein